MSGVTIFLSSLPFLNATYITSSSSSKLSDTISLLSFISHSILLFVKTVGIGVTVGAAVGVAVGLDVTVGIGTVVGIAVGLGVTVGTIVGVAVDFTVDVAVGLDVTVGVGTVVGIAVGLGVAVGVGTIVGVGVGTVVGVAVGFTVGVAVGVAVGIIALTALYAFNLPPLITRHAFPPSTSVMPTSLTHGDADAIIWLWSVPTSSTRQPMTTTSCRSPDVLFLLNSDYSLTNHLIIHSK